MESHLGTENKKVRILRIIARLNIGGPAMQAMYLNKAFNNGSFRSKLIYGSIDKTEGDMSYLLNGDNSSSIYIKEMARELNLFKDCVSFFRILTIMLRERPHIVHTHTAKAGTIGRLAAIITGVPIKIHTLHGHVFEGYFDDRKTAFFKKVESFLANFTDKIVILGPMLQEEIKDNLKIKDVAKFSIVPLGIEAGPFLKSASLKGEFKREFNIPGETRLVGIIGRLVPIKNHRMFIDAAKIILRDKKPKYAVKFVVVGDGQAREAIVRYAEENGISGEVIFTGWRRDLDKIYADLDVVSLCSLNEGTPVSLIEAMLASKPVVATDVGGVRDLVTHFTTGYLVRKGNTEEFASRIIELLDDRPGAKIMGEAAREYARKIYYKERLAQDLETIYRDLLKRKGLTT